MNLYTYCEGDPVNSWDPTGHWQEGDEELPQWAQDAIATYTSWYTTGDSELKEMAHARAELVRSFIKDGYYQSRSDWGAKPANEDMEQISGTRADYYDTIVIHHTDRSQNENITDFQSDVLSGVEFADIPYHFVIGADGTVYEGRSLNYEGAHCSVINTGKTGIAVMGNFQPGNVTLGNIIQGALPTEPTPDQRLSVIHMTMFLSDAYGVNSIGGHRDYGTPGATQCPGDSLEALIPYLQRFITK